MTRIEVRTRVVVSLTGTGPAWQTMEEVTLEETHEVGLVWWAASLLTGTVPAWQTRSGVETVVMTVSRNEVKTRMVSLTGTGPAWQTVVEEVLTLAEIHKVDLVWWAASLLTGTGPACQTRTGVETVELAKVLLTGTEPAWLTLVESHKGGLVWWSASLLTGTKPAWQTRTGVETVLTWQTVEGLLTGTRPAWQTVENLGEVYKVDLVEGTTSLLTGTVPAWQTGL